MLPVLPGDCRERGHESNHVIDPETPAIRPYSADIFLYRSLPAMAPVQALPNCRDASQHSARAGAFRRHGVAPPPHLLNFCVVRRCTRQTRPQNWPPFHDVIIDVMRIERVLPILRGEGLDRLITKLTRPRFMPRQENRRGRSIRQGPQANKVK
jgi:hypothetical protein